MYPGTDVCSPVNSPAQMAMAEPRMRTPETLRIAGKWDLSVLKTSGGPAAQHGEHEKRDSGPDGVREHHEEDRETNPVRRGDRRDRAKHRSGTGDEHEAEPGTEHHPARTARLGPDPESCERALEPVLRLPATAVRSRGATRRTSPA